jgi:hypothetical protein
LGYTPKTISRRVTYRPIVLKAFGLLDAASVVGGRQEAGLLCGS